MSSHSRGAQNVGTDRGLLAGWFVEKLKRFGDAILVFIWWLIRHTWWLMRLTPSQRCYFSMLLYEKFLTGLCADLDAGRLRDHRDRQTALRVASWINQRLKAWQNRVRSEEPAT
jgi:hypothetical protein